MYLNPCCLLQHQVASAPFGLVSAGNDLQAPLVGGSHPARLSKCRNEWELIETCGNKSRSQSTKSIHFDTHDTLNPKIS